MTKGKRGLRVCRREFKQIVDGGMAAYNMKEISTPTQNCGKKQQQQKPR